MQLPNVNAMQCPTFKSKSVSTMFQKYVAEALVAVWKMEKESGKYPDYNERSSKAFEVAANSMKDMAYETPKKTPKYMLKRCSEYVGEDRIKDYRVATIFNKYILWALTWAYGVNAYDPEDYDLEEAVRYKNACDCVIERLSNMEYSVR